MQSVLRAIQQRKIDRVAAAYAVAAWIFVQAASIALPTFNAPIWVLKAVIVAAALGFPVALWIAWHAAAPAQSISPDGENLRRTDLALLGVLAVVVVLVGGQFAVEMGAWRPGQHTGTANHGRAMPEPPSVAVLPFLNLSGDPGKEYFSDGIADELLNHLANARNLRVAARTSSFAFKGKSEDIRRIARALNVNAVVEGSVREDGRHIRIAAQLVKGDDGYPIWSKSYDRDLSNVLQLQDEIAKAIAAALTNTLLPVSAQAKAARAPINPQAYRDYLRAKSLVALKTDEADRRVVEILNSVTEREPKFAPAFAALARVYAHMAQFHNQQPELLGAAGTASKQALKLDTRNLEGLSIALYLASVQWNWNAASEDAHKLQAINPHSAFALRGLYYYYTVTGFLEQQAATLREVIRLDPLSFVDLNNLAAVYNDRGQYVEAASAATDALALKPNRPLTLYTLCLSYAGMDRPDKARTIVAKLNALHQHDAAEGCALSIAAASGQLDEARRIAASIASRFPAFTFSETDIGSFYAIAHDFTGAQRWLERAFDKRNLGLFSIIYSPITPPELLKTPGWKRLMARPEARAWQAAHDRIARELKQG